MQLSTSSSFTTSSAKPAASFGLSLFAGLLFGLGLLVSGMSNPAKVTGFLDVAGLWDPSLAFVMLGALAVAAPAFAWVKRRPRSLLGTPIKLPATGRLDRRLVIGSLIFGAGWGLAGICPGPALVLLGAGSAKGLGFVLAMLVGMLLAERYTQSAGI